MTLSVNRPRIRANLRPLKPRPLSKVTVNYWTTSLQNLPPGTCWVSHPLKGEAEIWQISWVMPPTVPRDRKGRSQAVAPIVAVVPLHPLTARERTYPRPPTLLDRPTLPWATTSRHSLATQQPEISKRPTY